MKFQNSYYTATICRISGKGKTENIAISAVLNSSYKDNKDILQPGYTAQNGSISRIGLQYIQCYIALTIERDKL